MMPDDKRKGENVAKPDEVKASLARAAEMIDKSRREIERSRQIMKDTDPTNKEIDSGNDDADLSRAHDPRRG